MGVFPAASVFKEAQYKEARPTAFFFFSFQPAADDFQVAQFGGYSLMLATLIPGIPGSIFPVQFSRWKLEPTSMVIILGEVSWERCINRIASLASSLKMSSFR